jgi:tetratricopeptide (TPR) repeat protein
MIHRFWIAPFLVVALATGSGLAMTGHPAKQLDGKPPLLSETGRHHHPIATTSREAQKFFDQGMTLLFGFNHPAAARSFQRAAELDPKAVMPHWGIAVVLGPNYNQDIDLVDPAQHEEAYEALERAISLSADAPARERAYVAALAKRYTTDPKADLRKLQVDYKDAMGELVRAYPDDLDAATLYAESLMNLRPWRLWNPDGAPAEGTEEIVRVLEEVLRRDPEHIGANHYYIHAVEASPYPERALPSADRLSQLVPWAGHLVHMPAHIYIRTGDFERAARANELAAKADERFFRRTDDKGPYRAAYYTHNLQFLAFARAAQGNYGEAKRAADKLLAIVKPEVAQDHMMEALAQIPLLVQLRFHRWDEVLKAPAPDPELLLSRSFWHYSRALALAANGKGSEAAEEQRAFEAVRKEVPAKAMPGNNTTDKVLGVAAAVLEARLANDPDTAITHWRRAVELEDALAYGEPPDWYYPVRESLGAALLRAGQAAEAEQVFREDLKRNRRNGRSLFGLMVSLKAQRRITESELVSQEFARAWKQAAALRIEDL